jgi:hypothetical protein
MARIPPSTTITMVITGVFFILVYCFPTVAQGVLAAFWNMASTNNIPNLQQLNHHLAILHVAFTAFQSDYLYRQNCSRYQHSVTTAPFPFQVHFPALRAWRIHHVDTKS